MYHCHVCGCQLDDAPWGENGQEPSFDICDCCGCEFGYQDCQASGVVAHRERWLAAGANWFDPSRRPSDWKLEQQLTLIPQELPNGIRHNQRRV